MKRFLFRMFYFLGFHGIAKKIDPIAYYFYHLNDSLKACIKQTFERLNENEVDETLAGEELANTETDL